VACVAGVTGWTSKSSSLLIEGPGAHSKVVLLLLAISNARIGVGDDIEAMGSNEVGGDRGAVHVQDKIGREDRRGWGVDSQIV
jgi:hypothetical protein